MQYISGKFYKKNDVVLKNGIYYVARLATNKDPESSKDWQPKAGVTQPANTSPVIIKEHVKGDKGDKGDRGERGIQGAKGERGDKGDRGERGEKGDKGDRGIDGKNGKGGKDGKDGRHGLNGKDGKNGENGLDGKDGLSLYYKWDGTKLGIRREDEPEFQFVDLKGDAAPVQAAIGSGGGRTRFKDIVGWFNSDDISVDYANKIISIVGGGGGGGAPTGAEYVTLATNGSLTNERVLTAGTGIDITDGGAGAAVTVSLNTATQSSLALADSSIQSSDIGSTVQAHSSVLDATTASFTTAQETKLAGIESGADVTDATNVAAAGALMASNNLSDVGSAATAFTNIKQAASDTATGVVELATIAETNTGTDTGRAVTPDGLAGSVFGTKTVVVKVIADSTALTTGDNKTKFVIPVELNGMDLVSVGAHVFTASTSGLPTIQIHNATDAVDMLSTSITIDANEKDSSTAATAAVINTAADDVATGDEIRIDVDGAGTGTAGLEIRLGFRKP